MERKAHSERYLLSGLSIAATQPSSSIDECQKERSIKDCNPQKVIDKISDLFLHPAECQWKKPVRSRYETWDMDSRCPVHDITLARDSLKSLPPGATLPLPKKRFELDEPKFHRKPKQKHRSIETARLSSGREDGVSCQQPRDASCPGVHPAVDKLGCGPSPLSELRVGEPLKDTPR